MPEWLFAGLVGLAGTGGLIIGNVISARTSRRASERTDTQQLVDQLQEELVSYRAEQSARSTAMDERMTDLERRNDQLMRERDGYRDYAHELRSHVYDQKPPPPPAWPEGLPR